MRDADLKLHAGEILGVAALEGQGQIELFRALSGLAQPEAGTVLANGRAVALKGTRCLTTPCACRAAQKLPGAREVA